MSNMVEGWRRSEIGAEEEEERVRLWANR